MSLTVKELQDFEEEVAQIYKEGRIKAPVHLRTSQDGTYERNLIEIFKRVQPEDFVYNYWAAHIHCLLKGVPRDVLLDEIIKGNSISLSFPKYGILCSGIVGSLVGVAVGHAWGLYKQKKKGKIWHFGGDMFCQNGNFYEAVKYSYGHTLPIEFIIEDNGLSVMTDTEATWGVSMHDTYKILHDAYPTQLTYFKYKNSRPHSGVNERVKF